MTREEHLQLAKGRALEYLNAGDIQNAVTSMMSDLSKHPDFIGGAYNSLNLLGIMYAANHNERGARRWIEGFN